MKLLVSIGIGIIMTMGIFFFFKNIEAQVKDMDSIIINKGDTLKITEDFSLIFDGHSHKRTKKGQKSPLIVNVSYITPDSTVRDYNNLKMPPKGWTWDKYEFTINDYSYNDWMNLTIKEVPKDSL